jgi:hypothetical protein
LSPVVLGSSAVSLSSVCTDFSANVVTSQEQGTTRLFDYGEVNQSRSEMEQVRSVMGSYL